METLIKNINLKQKDLTKKHKMSFYKYTSWPSDFIWLNLYLWKPGQKIDCDMAVVHQPQAIMSMVY